MSVEKSRENSQLYHKLAVTIIKTCFLNKVHVDVLMERAEFILKVSCLKLV